MQSDHEELERLRRLEALDDLLPTLAGVLDMRDVFTHISDIAQRVLPHDGLAIILVGDDRRHVIPYAVRVKVPWELPPQVDVSQLPHLLQYQDPAWKFAIVADMQAVPEERMLPPVRMGYRASLRVPIRINGELAAVMNFMSFSADIYREHDAFTARRIADHLALALSHQRLAEAAERAAEARERAARLEARVQSLSDELTALGGRHRVVGESALWRAVLKHATQVAPTDTTVLLQGESGTGKEVIARFVHRGSARRAGPFIALNCAALPDHLLESELFGFERGAFTGATQAKPGQIELAAGGTLLLDEVTEMSSPAQAKLLRVLQEREVQRLGSTRTRHADVRVIAATNRNLRRAMEQGTLREDLFYRLNVFPIVLPPLRERREDVLPLSEAFLAEIGRTFGRPPAGISREARAALLAHEWPGNVRELRNTLERAAIVCEGGLILAEHLGLRVPDALPRAISMSPASSAAASTADAASMFAAAPDAPAQGLASQRSSPQRSSAQGSSAQGSSAQGSPTQGAPADTLRNGAPHGVGTPAASGAFDLPDAHEAMAASVETAHAALAGAIDSAHPRGDGVVSAPAAPTAAGASAGAAAASMAAASVVPPAADMPGRAAAPTPKRPARTTSPWTAPTQAASRQAASTQSTSTQSAATPTAARADAAGWHPVDANAIAPGARVRASEASAGAPAASATPAAQGTQAALDARDTGIRHTKDAHRDARHADLAGPDFGRPSIAEPFPASDALAERPMLNHFATLGPEGLTHWAPPAPPPAPAASPTTMAPPTTTGSTTAASMTAMSPLAVAPTEAPPTAAASTAAASTAPASAAAAWTATPPANAAPGTARPVVGPPAIASIAGAADLQALEKSMIERALIEARHNKSHAARLLGLSRTQFYVRLRRHGLDR